MDTTLRLHVWPSQWDIPSFHPQCLAAILYAQLAIPGKFEVHECSNPDSSPNGLLPYLTHGLKSLATLPSIIKYISNLRGADLDASLSPTEKAQRTAWAAFVEAHLGDLVACAFYAITDNYNECVRPALASKLPLPQRYYLPDRLRDTYQPRLDAAGLWNVNVEKKKDKENQPQPVAVSSLLQQRVRQTFAKEKVISKAKPHLDILKNLIGDKNYVFRDHPTFLDTLIASHVILLTESPLPNDTLLTLITQSYPNLHAHAKRVYTVAFGGPERPSSPLSASVSFLGPIPEPVPAPRPPQLTVIPTNRQTLTEIIPQLFPIRFHEIFTRNRDTPSVKAEDEKTEEEKEAFEKMAAEEREFARMRWLWIGLAAAGVVGWGVISGLRIKFVGAEENDEDSEEGAGEELESDGGDGDDDDDDGGYSVVDEEDDDDEEE